MSAPPPTQAARWDRYLRHSWLALWGEPFRFRRAAERRGLRRGWIEARRIRRLIAMCGGREVFHTVVPFASVKDVPEGARANGSSVLEHDAGRCLEDSE